jgi:hypothetical protein
MPGYNTARYGFSCFWVTNLPITRRGIVLVHILNKALALAGVLDQKNFFTISGTNIFILTMAITCQQIHWKVQNTIAYHRDRPAGGSAGPVSGPTVGTLLR